MSEFSILPFADSDREWARGLLRQDWGSEKVVVHRETFYPADLAGFIAWRGGCREGLVTIKVDGNICEIVTLKALKPNLGIGGALINAVKTRVRELGCCKLTLTTTNDNTRALRFYQKQGFRLSALRIGAMDEARELKPEIPLLGVDNIPIRDEIDMELAL